MRFFPTFDRQFVLLLIAQAISGSAPPVLFLISGLQAPAFSPSLALSTLPMSLFIVGIALASPIASSVMSKIGRKSGHLVGLLITLLGVALVSFTLYLEHFYGFCISNLICGLGVAFNNQIRFTAAEGAAQDQKALVHSWVLMCSLFAAILGPGILQYGKTMLPQGAYLGSLAILIAVLVGLTIVLLFLPTQQTSPPSGHLEKATPLDIVSQSKFWLAALCGICSFATMTLLMSATPIQMHTLAHFSAQETTFTIQSHIMAMFLPSLFSGMVLAWLGIRRLITAGISIFLICIALAYTSTTCHDYWWALVLLGVGWNFLFLAGSTWVSQSFTGAERFTAQGLNDALVYGTQALASLAAGWLLFAVGWTTLVLIPLPLLIGLLGIVWWKK